MLKWLYSVLIVLGIGFLIFGMYNIIGSPDKTTSYLVVFCVLSLIFLGLTVLIMSKDMEKLKTCSLYFVILIVEILVTINLLSIPEFTSKLFFYTVLMMIANIILFISEFGNFVGLENGEDGFNINIHSKDSIIPPRWIIPVWIITFFIMGGAVLGMGSAFIGYPAFGVGSLSGSVASSFPVADAENIVLLVTPFALSMYFFNRKGFPKIASSLISTVVAMVTFLVYHNIVYAFNIPALTSVLLFSFLTIIVYQVTKSLVIPSAMHFQNFWASLYSKNVFTFQVFTTSNGGSGGVVQSGMNMIPTILIGILILWCFVYRKDLIELKNKGLNSVENSNILKGG